LGPKRHPSDMRCRDQYTWVFLASSSVNSLISCGSYTPEESRGAGL
jgi:hypothetical protein